MKGTYREAGLVVGLAERAALGPPLSVPGGNGGRLCSLALGHPFWGTHKKMNENDEQELREFMRLKHHSHELKNQQFG